MVSPWPPPDSGQANLPPPPPANSGTLPRPSARRRWPKVAVGLAVVVAAMAGAGLTYEVMSHRSAPPPAESQSSLPPVAPAHSDAERADAKQHVCDVFYASTRGQMDRGATVVDGEPNVPVVLRTLGSVVAVENALAPATPPEVVAAAQKYVDTALDVTTASMEGVSIEELTRLTVVGNDAIYAFADLCGLKH